MRRIRDERVPAVELERAKNYIASASRARFETTDDIAGNLAELELYRLGDDCFDRVRRRVREVTADDVQRVANRYLDPLRGPSSSRVTARLSRSSCALSASARHARSMR